MAVCSCAEGKKMEGEKSGPGSPVFVVHSCRAGVFVLVLYPRAVCVS